jgi:hypothetical protein
MDKQFKGYVQTIQDRHYNRREPQAANGLTLMIPVENHYKGILRTESG